MNAMGVIFNQELADLYHAWYHSPEGRAIDKSIEKLILTLLEPKAGERVLDIGCGTGEHLLIFSKMGLNVSGIDASPYMIGKARERLGNRCTLRTAAAEDLPFDDNEFDVAVLINTLEFLDDPLRAIMEAGRVARRKVFLGVLNSLSLEGLLKRIRGYFGDPLFGRACFYNLWRVKFLLEKACGPVPISWRCIQIYPAFMENPGDFRKGPVKWKSLPFGSFLGVSATMTYRFRTAGHPLKIKGRLKEAGQSLIGARTLRNLNRSEGDFEDERSLPL